MQVAETDDMRLYVKLLKQLRLLMEVLSRHIAEHEKGLLNLCWAGLLIPKQVYAVISRFVNTV